MNALSSRRQSPLVNPVERRVSIATRTPQLVTSRSLLFMVGGLCIAFGVLALWLAQLEASPEEKAAQQTAEVTDGGRAKAAQETRWLHGIIASFGALVVVLTTQIYRAPLLVAVACTLLFVGTFTAFLLLHHSELPVLYVLASFVVLAVMIKALVSAGQFLQSFARMGRPDEH